MGLACRDVDGNERTRASVVISRGSCYDWKAERRTREKVRNKERKKENRGREDEERKNKVID